jgi:hypothetical protein
MKNLLILLAIHVLIISGVHAQFSISAHLRPRAEMNNGTGAPVPDTISTLYYITQRSRLQFDYNNDKFQTRFTLQDVRVWGNGEIYSGTGVFSSTNSLDVFEAWFKIKFGLSSDLTVGRQVLKYDDQRIIAGRNWNQYGLAYDAVVFNHYKNGWDVNAGLSYNNMINPGNGKPVYGGDLFDANNLMKSFNFVRVKRKFSEKFSASFLATGAGYQKTTDPGVLYMMGTAGFWASLKSGGFEATANAYYQLGKAQSGQDVSSYMLTVDPGYRTGNVRFGAGLDYISGDDATRSDYGEKVKTFNTMYGAVFAYFGWMNYYAYMPGATKSGGLLDVYPNVEFGFENKHKIRAYFHIFSLANQIKLADELIEEQGLGQELDLMYIYNYSKELTLQAGFSYYFTSETLEQLKGVANSNIASPYWAWVMLTFKPVLFSTR